MSPVGVVAGLLAWPGGSGVAGGAIAAVVLGAPAYARAHLTGRRRHGERLAQAERHHAEHLAQATTHHNVLVQRLTVAAQRLTAADAQVSAGAGSNPAGAGLPADERVVPPAAAKRKARTP